MSVRALRNKWSVWIEKARRVDDHYGREASLRYLLGGRLPAFILGGSEEDDRLDAVEEFAAAIRREYPLEEIREWFSEEIAEAWAQGVKGMGEGSPAFLRFLEEMYFSSG